MLRFPRVVLNILHGVTGYLTLPVRFVVVCHNIVYIYLNIVHVYVPINVFLCLVVTLNTQVHESTNHTPDELVFCQPPRSLVIPDNKLAGKIDEEDLGEVQIKIPMYTRIV